LNQLCPSWRKQFIHCAGDAVALFGQDCCIIEMAAAHQRNYDAAAIIVEQGRLDDDDIGNGFPMFADIL
jgi:hypothetical protein